MRESDAAWIPEWETSAREFRELSETLDYYSAITQCLIDAIDGSSKVVVDFGCGYGRFSRQYLAALGAAAAGRTLVLVDNAPAMLDLTSDIQHAGVTVHRIRDDASLAHLPAGLAGRVDAIACNASIYLLRKEDLSIDIEGFLRRASQILRPGGVVAANIPDQAYEFRDGWQSEFHRHAHALWPDSEKRSRLPKLNDALCARAAAAAGLSVELSRKVVRLTWRDFVTFYSIPALGRNRVPGRSQQDRLKLLNEIEPRFDAVDYHWRIAKFRQMDR